MFTFPLSTPLFLLPTAATDISLENPSSPPRRAVVVRSNGGFASGRFEGFVKYDVSLKRGLFDRGNEFPTWNNNVT